MNELNEFNKKVRIEIALGDCEKIGSILEEQGEQELADIFFERWLKRKPI